MYQSYWKRTYPNDLIWSWLALQRPLLWIRYLLRYLGLGLQHIFKGRPSSICNMGLKWKWQQGCFPSGDIRGEFSAFWRLPTSLGLWPFPVMAPLHPFLSHLLWLLPPSYKDPCDYIWKIKDFYLFVWLPWTLRAEVVAWELLVGAHEI